jgi:RNA polymerase sigma factor (sigma-70 family)
MPSPRDWPPTSDTLIGRLQADANGPAWGLLVEVYGPLIYRFCRRRGLQDADARDVSQSVFLAIRQGIQRFEFDPAKGKFRSWLGTIAAREISRSQQRAQRAGQATEQATAGHSQPLENDAVWVVEFNSHLCDVALGRIRPDFEELTWQAFELLWIHDQKPAVVAAQLNKPIDWVYQVKYRVVRRLEKEILLLTADIPSFTKGDLP